MPIIDADAHVVETEATWDFMEPADQKYRPLLVRPGAESKTAYWFVDGKMCGQARSVVTARELQDLSRTLGRDVAAPPEARDMEDVGVRLEHMDRLGVDVQVLHATIFIEQVAWRVQTEIAVCKGWNRWLADIWRQGQGRLRWSCVLPLQDLDAAVEELRFCKEHGACAVFMRSIEGPRLLYDPYFYPLYEEVSRLDMPIVVHVGVANPYYLDLLSQYNGRGAGFWKFRLSSVGAAHSWVLSEVPQLFPRLRVGILEAGAQWVPHVVKDLRRRSRAQGKQLTDAILKDNRVYVACETDDDLPYILRYAGEDNIVIGTDYGHTDQGSELEALRNLRQQGDLAEATYRKIVDDNARALYGL
jgi:predicted TIM-barrel fold metal-dependent hydrolase